MKHTREPGIYLKGRYICRECTKREAFSVLWPCGPSEYQRGREDAAEAILDLHCDLHDDGPNEECLVRASSAAVAARGDGEQA